MTLFYSHNNQQPEPLPLRIRLPNGFTRTDPSTFTEDEIAAAGFTGPYSEPSYDPATEQLDWVDNAFVVKSLPSPSPEPEPINLMTTANGILAAASLNDKESLAGLLTDLISAAHKG
tara:strand:- start:689 stop:1039 length:351 start_codon:yes stop_codon:yes gene_type:complete